MEKKNVKLQVWIIESWDIKSISLDGRYFSTQGRFSFLTTFLVGSVSTICCSSSFSISMLNLAGFLIIFFKKLELNLYI